MGKFNNFYRGTSYHGKIYFTMVLSTMVKYTAPKYHGINTMVILWYFSSRVGAEAGRTPISFHSLSLFPSPPCPFIDTYIHIYIKNIYIAHIILQ